MEFDTKEDVAKAFFFVIMATMGFIFTVAFLAIYYSWAAVLLWKWFLVPLGVPQVGMAHMCGIITLIGMVVRGVPVKYKDHEEDGYNRLITTLIVPVISVFFGFIYKTLM